MMKKVPPPVPIAQPTAPPAGLAADVVASGLPVHPEDRVRLFSPDQWERFVQEWVDSLRDEYELVERCGGAGDMGRDIIATVKGCSKLRLWETLKEINARKPGLAVHLDSWFVTVTPRIRAPIELQGPMKSTANHGVFQGESGYGERLFQRGAWARVMSMVLRKRHASRCVRHGSRDPAAFGMRRGNG